MTVSNIASDAHQIARSKGFWSRESAAVMVPTKVALIHTEITEALDCCSVPIDEARLCEELADVLIRSLDLSVALDFPIRTYAMLDGVEAMQSTPLTYRVSRLHHYASGIVQHDRRDDPPRRNAALASLMAATVEIGLAVDPGFWEIVLEKQEKNRDRPHRHDRRY